MFLEFLNEEYTILNRYLVYFYSVLFKTISSIRIVLTVFSCNKGEFILLLSWLQHKQ